MDEICKNTNASLVFVVHINELIKLNDVFVEKKKMLIHGSVPLPWLD